ncbi:mucin-like protein 1 isoform X1 [Prionailurus bengalensis]|uniref:mucin-like protein 1 isoform X1 n=1 Tax=Prionailurus bengalensis TaxID=37029 RepID=UPI001CA8E0B8|nr:mucin-like protein 1 isoform X1 [Prionailurus bengalensis]
MWNAEGSVLPSPELHAFLSVLPANQLTSMKKLLALLVLVAISTFLVSGQTTGAASDSSTAAATTAAATTAAATTAAATTAAATTAAPATTAAATTAAPATTAAATTAAPTTPPKSPLEVIKDFWNLLL